MKVILKKHVRKLGKVGEIVNVADGYGRNYLIPKDFAIRATKSNVAQFAEIQKQLEGKNNEAKIAAEEAAKKIQNANVIFVTQSAADGRLFGSVSAKAIATELSKMANYVLTYNNILLENPIKFNGVYKIEVALHPEVLANILVVVVKTESEAQDALMKHKEEDNKNNPDVQPQEEGYEV